MSRLDPSGREDPIPRLGSAKHRRRFYIQTLSDACMLHKNQHSAPKYANIASLLGPRDSCGVCLDCRPPRTPRDAEDSHPYSFRPEAFRLTEPPMNAALQPRIENAELTTASRQPLLNHGGNPYRLSISYGKAMQRRNCREVAYLVTYPAWRDTSDPFGCGRRPGWALRVPGPRPAKDSRSRPNNF
jgi:hypothetical protein